MFAKIALLSAAALAATGVIGAASAAPQSHGVSGGGSSAHASFGGSSRMGGTFRSAPSFQSHASSFQSHATTGVAPSFAASATRNGMRSFNGTGTRTFGGSTFSGAASNRFARTGSGNWNGNWRGDRRRHVRTARGVFGFGGYPYDGYDDGYAYNNCYYGDGGYRWGSVWRSPCGPYNAGPYAYDYSGW